MYLNTALIQEALTNEADKTVTHSFVDGDVLKIVERPAAVIIISELTFDCGSARREALIGL